MPLSRAASGAAAPRRRTGKTFCNFVRPQVHARAGAACRPWASNQENQVDNTSVQLTAEQRSVIASLPEQSPVVMLNMLRFRDQAAYEDQSEACTGREAYKRYSRTSLQTIAAVGGEVIFIGKAHEALIAPADESWHQVFLVRYPSPAAFQSMLSMPEYQAGVRHRTAALADSRLIPMTPQGL
jgi:uncharacterized protein (DUF1330 family)